VVPGILEQGGNGDHIVVQGSLVMLMLCLVRGKGLRDVGDTVAVTVYACQQHAPGGCAGGCCMIIGEKQAFISQLADVGRLDFTPVGSSVCETKVVGQDQDDVG